MSVNVHRSSANMAFPETMRKLQGSFGFNDLALKFKAPPGISAIGQNPYRYHYESNIYAPKSAIRQRVSTEPLHIFVLGPSSFAKRRLIECASSHKLGISGEKDIHLAYNIGGFLLQGVEVEINLWHVGKIYRSLSALQELYHRYRTCFMLVYDVNDSTTFDDVHRWIPSLRNVLDSDVSIVLVGYENCEGPLSPKMIPVSFSKGVWATAFFELKAFYEFSDQMGNAAIDLVYEAAHIALESKAVTPNSVLAG